MKRQLARLIFWIVVFICAMRLFSGISFGGTLFRTDQVRPQVTIIIFTPRGVHWHSGVHWHRVPTTRTHGVIDTGQGRIRTIRG